MIMLLRLHGCSFLAIYRRHYLALDVQPSDPYNLSDSSSGMLLEPFVWGLCCRSINWGWASHSQLRSAFGPAVTFQKGLCCKKEALMGAKLHLPVDIRASISNVVGNNTGLGKWQ